jgi:polyisoprenyl-phosphate glycosyltransferase
MVDPVAVEGNGARRLGLLSVVAALGDAGAQARALHERVGDALEGVPYELILVDDGSTDGTADVLDELAAGDPRVRVIHLSRSFGAELALTAGLDHSNGDALVVLDPDLRDPPEAIRLLLDEWRAGAEVVYGMREGAQDGGAAGFITRPLARMAGVELEAEAGELRLLDRRAIEAVRAMRERSRFLRGMTVWVGMRQTAVAYRPMEPAQATRRGGTSSAVRHALASATAFSQGPLRVATVAGLALGALALLALPVVLIVGILAGLGVTVAAVVVLALGGVQLVIVGILGAYVSRIYDEVKQRPLYVVRETRNLPGSAAAEPADQEPAPAP